MMWLLNTETVSLNAVSNLLVFSQKIISLFNFSLAHSEKERYNILFSEAICHYTSEKVN